jgi:beta-glucosidase-like glycosyl hydrolase/CubicO group peptidase (beta-lactamase class C family)
VEEKAAQLVGVRLQGIYRNPASAEARRLLRDVGLGVGTLVVFDSDVESLPRRLNELQAAARLPLLVAADLERGLSFRIRRGVVPLPYAMAVGATRSEADARFTGAVAAREARALGVHWALAPVADVNSNPRNPIINIRSYGEDPELVAQLSTAFLRGLREGGLLATLKHFPGHGDTSVDSHLRLPVLAGDRERLERIELLPFRRGIAAGADAVMLGHVAVPALDPSGAPASLSAPIASGLLRGELGFQGLVATDALDMSGARGAWAGDAAVRAVNAGADVLLLPPDPVVVVQALARAVREGQLALARLDAAALRVLQAKERLGLDRVRAVDEARIGRGVERPEDVEGALGVARRAITLVRNEGGVLPLHADEALHVLHLVLSSDLRNELVQGFPEEELEQRRVSVETVKLGPEVLPETIDELVARSAGFSHVVASCFARVSAARGSAEMASSHARLLQALARAGRKLVAISFGSPYLLEQFPEVPAYLCAYGAAESSQRAAIAAVFGENEVGGLLPVTLPGLYRYGHGIVMPRRSLTLREAEAGPRPARPYGRADAVVEKGVAERAFPGAVLAVVREGALAHLAAFGRLSYEADAAAVQPATIYDLASLTKVVVTTTMAMILVDEGKLDLAQPVRAFVPAFHGGAKDQVSVEQLLSHSSGLDWWSALHRETRGKQAFLDRICAAELAYEPGSKSVYSDLGVLLLGEVLERVAGESLETFSRARVLEPLGMRETMYRPGPALLPRIAPTERDPWRGRVMHGEVHDENAWALGGVAPHAGLFGTAPDLARFAQMLLQGGAFDGHRIVSRATLERFTRRAGIPGSSRALGWDTPSGESSSAGHRLSERAFGHTGFTGTSLWIDPDKKLAIILLTNRVHPTRDNDAIRRIRPEVADAVAEAVAP